MKARKLISWFTVLCMAFITFSSVAFAAEETETKGYMLYIYNADGSQAMAIDGTKAVDETYSIKSALDDARVFVDNAILFNITTPATYKIELYEGSIEDESFEIGSDVTVKSESSGITVNEGVTLTLNGCSVDVATLANNATVAVYGETTLNIDTLSGNSIDFMEGSVIKDSTIGGPVYVGGNVTFKGDNKFTMITDYGDYYSSVTPSMWTVEKGGSLTLTKSDRYGLGYGDKVTVYGELEEGAALTSRSSLTAADADVNMYGGLVGMTNSAAPNAQNSFTAEDAYLRFGFEGDKSFGNKAGSYYGNYTFTFDNVVMDANAFKFYEDKGTSTVSFKDSDLYANGIFMTNDTSSTFSFENTKVFSNAKANGTDDKNQNAGTLNLTDSELTYSVKFTNVGTVNMDAASKLTAPEITTTGTIVIDASELENNVETLIIEQTLETAASLEGQITVENGEGVLVIYDGGDVKLLKTSSDPVAKIGDVEYNTLQTAVDAATGGDTITVIANVSDEAVSVDKSLTITGTATLENVTFNAVSGCEELKIEKLSFTGNSWINSGEADKLTVSGVTANVEPVNTTYTNSRSGFISLGRNEQKQLELVVENSSIVTGGDRTDPIIGWAAVKTVTITGNTFGSENAYQSNSDSVKFMGIAQDAIFTITDNTVYSNYNGFVFGQNTTRDNAYTVILDGNSFYGGADHIWIEVTGANTVHAKIEATSANTVNGSAMTLDDIKALNAITTWTGYVGIDVEKNNSGKLTGGTFTTDVTAYLAEGYKLSENEDGTYSVELEFELPTATVTEIPESELDPDVPLTFALKFTAAEASEAQLTAYGDWYADYVLTINKTATFNSDGSADGYLAGEYGDYGWISVPFENVTLEANKPFRIMEYASKIKPEFKITYNDVVEFVKEFNCGVYFDDAFLAKNPDLEVTLELRMYNSEDETESYTIGETYKFSGKGKYIFGYKPFVVRNMPIKQRDNGEGEIVDYCEVAFFAGIDSLDYKTIGFKVEAYNGETTVWDEIPAVGEDGKYYVYKDITVTGSEGSQTVTAEKIDSYRIFGIQVPFEKSVYDNKDVWFTPYAENFDGTKTYGLRYSLPDIYTK